MFLADGADPPVFRHVAGPGANDLQGLVEQIAARVGQVLERRGLIERAIDNVDVFLRTTRRAGLVMNA